MTTIRDITPADYETVAFIKSLYILRGTANFNEQPLTAEDIAGSVADAKRDRGCFLVAEDGGTILGFAAADRFRPQSANRLAELSIYLAPEKTGRGTGRQLLDALITRLRNDGFYAGLMAVITADNLGSIDFHRQAGFADAGYWRRAAWKFDSWHDVMVLEYLLR